MRVKLLLASLLFAGALHAQTINLEQYATGFNNLTEIVNAGDDRFFVAIQTGAIRILNADGTTNPTPFLNVASLISSGGERGLLGLAFHPDYATNGYFYINYTNPAGNTVIARYTRDSANPSLADPASALVLMTIDQPFANHNGGCLRFGSDNYLHISMGDGGGAGDPQGNAQNKNTLLGKMLRIDVNNGTTYTSPPDNPFVGIEGADEIWATGLRNAWKFSFDRLSGEIWIADVGQNAIEEINRANPDADGLNYGWRCFEGTENFNTDGCSIVEMYTQPFAQYTHASTQGCSITGGYVYRGMTYPAMQGKYIFTDYCNDKIGMAAADGTLTYTSSFSGNNFTAFGESATGELFVGGKTSGTIYRIVDSSLNTKSFAGTSFSIYPNPSAGVINIKSDSNGLYAVSAQVYELSGKLLLSHNLENTHNNTLQTSALPTGMYMMTIVDNTGKVSSHKLAVQ